jgi:hypothetical protein
VADEVLATEDIAMGFTAFLKSKDLNGVFVAHSKCFS